MLFSERKSIILDLPRTPSCIERKPNARVYKSDHCAILLQKWNFEEREEGGREGERKSERGREREGEKRKEERKSDAF